MLHLDCPVPHVARLALRTHDRLARLFCKPLEHTQKVLSRRHRDHCRSVGSTSPERHPQPQLRPPDSRSCGSRPRRRLRRRMLLCARSGNHDVVAGTGVTEPRASTSRRNRICGGEWPRPTCAPITASSNRRSNGPPRSVPRPGDTSHPTRSSRSSTDSNAGGRVPAFVRVAAARRDRAEIVAAQRRERPPRPSGVMGPSGGGHSIMPVLAGAGSEAATQALPRRRTACLVWRARSTYAPSRLCRAGGGDVPVRVAR